jgi:hypothetical protein
MRFMGIKDGLEHWEAEDGRVFKVAKLATERAPEFRDFPKGILFKRLQNDFDDNFKIKNDYGNDKLLNGLKSKKTIKLNRKVVKKSSYNTNHKELNNFI